MTWEERLLFLMFLDYKGALEKWEKNHNEDKNGRKIDDKYFGAYGGFCWRESQEGNLYWRNLNIQWEKVLVMRKKVPSLSYEIERLAISNTIEVGRKTITKKDALKIADFIYECFGGKYENLSSLRV